MALKIVTLNAYAECRNYAHYAECRFAECRYMLSDIMLNVVMLIIIILNVVMLNVVVPKNGLIFMNQIIFTCLVVLPLRIASFSFPNFRLG
jgi:hypothetical protein